MSEDTHGIGGYQSFSSFVRMSRIQAACQEYGDDALFQIHQRDETHDSP
jgi:hypothetical protein